MYWWTDKVSSSSITILHSIRTWISSISLWQIGLGPHKECFFITVITMQVRYSYTSRLLVNDIVLQWRRLICFTSQESRGKNYVLMKPQKLNSFRINSTQMLRVLGIFDSTEGKNFTSSNSGKQLRHCKYSSGCGDIRRRLSGVAVKKFRCTLG